MFIFIFIFKYGEKIILLLSKARYVTDDEKLINQIRNFCTHLEVLEVKVYWSHIFYNNIYYVNSYWGTPSIIIGKEVYNSLTKTELNSLIYATILRIKSDESKHRSTINILTLILFWWVFYFNNFLKNHNFLQHLLYPAFFMRKIIYSKSEDSNYFDKEIYKYDNLKREYVSALFKVSKFHLCNPFSVGSFVLSGLSHSTNYSEEMFMNILFHNEASIEERIRYITSNLK
jgi:hypothetical protein